MAIPRSLEYYKSSTVDAAVRLHEQLATVGKKPFYYSGGTEIIGSLRLSQIETQALIDIKGIPECSVLEYKNHQLVIGAAVTLNQLAEGNLFPLLTETVLHTADHTSRNKITLGGSMCSRLIYRESLLPLLLTDAAIVTAGKRGLNTNSVHDVFSSGWSQVGSELLVQVVVDGSFLNMPYALYKKTKHGKSKIDYPVVTVAGLKKEEELRFAFSGISETPFRSKAIEAALNNRDVAAAERIGQAVASMPGPFLNDFLSSAAFREFLFKHLLTQTLDTLDGVG